mmetsp:Transcript_14759/g.37554  ORF Transcript_14759/g.37554 Transcript_14759/m.37554 type:complete len:259 (+) Transcript_14759:499-1275(+)
MQRHLDIGLTQVGDHVGDQTRTGIRNVANRVLLGGMTRTTELGRVFLEKFTDRAPRKVVEAMRKPNVVQQKRTVAIGVHQHVVGIDSDAPILVDHSVQRSQHVRPNILCKAWTRVMCQDRRWIAHHESTKVQTLDRLLSQLGRERWNVVTTKGFTSNEEGSVLILWIGVDPRCQKLIVLVRSSVVTVQEVVVSRPATEANRCRTLQIDNVRQLVPAILVGHQVYRSRLGGPKRSVLGQKTSQAATTGTTVQPQQQRTR